ncbi:MAG: hypothetical protein CMO81_12515 [Waddliaceae bacterium]|nr:hypothetical protein [Waddliaceae bacterium]
MHKKYLSYFLVSAWCISLSLGFYQLVEYGLTEGSADHSVATWPASLHWPAKERKSVLVLNLHPLCPCSRATVRELRQIMEQYSTDVQLLVFAYIPDLDDKADWESHDYIETTLKQMPSTIWEWDEKGHNALQLGAHTSGDLRLFDSKRNLIFSGGITPSRGHEGPSIGKESIINYLENREAVQRTAPVFGCPIQDGDIDDRI